MGLNETPRSDRIHIAIFGRRNAGKSSIINALTGQEIAVVSPVAGTTTDPVYKAMELLPVGPVVFIDTAGLDDEGQLGELRKKKTFDVLNKTDVAIVVANASTGIGEFETSVVQRIRQKGIPVIGVINKVDEIEVNKDALAEYEKITGIKFNLVSALNKKGISMLKKAIIDAMPKDNSQNRIVGDLITQGDVVVLVVPIDESAPKGRLILPQQQTIRDILDSDAMAVVTKEYKLKDTLGSLAKKPRMVITDSQVFNRVSSETPLDIPLTSFSILFARYKGDLAQLVKGAKAVQRLRDGDKVLIAEACTHHIQDDDIGRIKIPRWLKQCTGKNLEFEFVSGFQFSEDIKEYSLIVHCGGCMINRKAMEYRIEQAVKAQVPIVNYGVLIAYVHGILERAISPFPEAGMVWNDNNVQIR